MMPPRVAHTLAADPPSLAAQSVTEELLSWCATQQRLRHTNIASPLSVVMSTAGVPVYILYELPCTSAPTLDAHMRVRGSCNLRELLELAEDVFSALAYCHTIPSVYIGELSFANVLVYSTRGSSVFYKVAPSVDAQVAQGILECTR